MARSKNKRKIKRHRRDLKRKRRIERKKIARKQDRG
jgi:hypothetical protein